MSKNYEGVDELINTAYRLKYHLWCAEQVRSISLDEVENDFEFSIFHNCSSHSDLDIFLKESLWLKHFLVSLTDMSNSSMKRLVVVFS